MALTKGKIKINNMAHIKPYNVKSNSTRRYCQKGWEYNTCQGSNCRRKRG